MIIPKVRPEAIFAVILAFNFIFGGSVILIDVQGVPVPTFPFYALGFVGGCAFVGALVALYPKRPD